MDEALVDPEAGLMRAVYQRRYGGRDKLEICTLPKPELKKGFVLIKVYAVSIHAGDHHVLTGRPYMMRAVVSIPAIPGMDFSGVVVEVGDADGSVWNVGDRCLGTADIELGAFAEYVSVPVTHIARVPENVTMQVAAAVPTSGMTALQALRMGKGVSKGDRVLINGASGGVGSFAVQLAKNMGAHVTGVCSSPNVKIVQSLGADVVVNYRKQSVDDAVAAAGGREEDKYNVIIDIVGRSGGWFPLLKTGGQSVAVALPESECIPCVICGIMCSPWCCCCLTSKKAHTFMQEVSGPDLQELVEMLAEGSLTANLGPRLVGIEAIPDALVGNSSTTGLGHTVGKTVVTLVLTNSPEVITRKEEEEEEVFVDLAGASPVLFDESSFTLKLRTGPTVRAFTRDKSGRVDERPLYVDDVWPGCKLLSRYIDENALCAGKKNVVELGAGCALPSVVAAVAGANLVVATDYPAPGVIDTIRDVFVANQLDVNSSPSSLACTCTPHALEWGNVTHEKEVLSLLPGSKSGYDLCLVAEPLWQDTFPCHSELAHSISAMVGNEGGYALLSFCHRPNNIHVPERDLSFFQTAREKHGLQSECIMSIKGEYSDVQVTDGTRIDVHLYKLWK